MSLARTVAFLTHKLVERDIPAFKTMIHKVVYLALPEGREELYRPYFYGPYSDQVQNTIQSLLKGEYLIPSPREFHLNEEKLLEKQGLRPESLIQDARRRRNLEQVMEFLKSEDFDSVEAVSNLSKVHYLSVRIGYREPDLIESVKHRAKYLGWTAIAEMEDDEVAELHRKAEELEAGLILES